MNPISVRWARAILALWAMGLLLSDAAAAVGSYKLQYPFSEDSTLAARVFHIGQDSRGYLWFAQTKSLKRYDGTRLVKVDSPEDLKWTALKADGDGNVWLGTREQGLYVWRWRTMQVEPFEDSTGTLPKQISAMALGDEGILWVASQYQGLTRVDTRDGSLTRFDAASIDDRPGPSPEITALAIDASAHLWIGSAAGQVFRRAAGSPEFERISTGLELGAISAIAAGETSLWVGTVDGDLAKIDRETHASRLVGLAGMSDDPRRGRIKTLVEDRQGQLWVGTKLGLGILSADESEFVPVETDPDRPVESEPRAIEAIYLDHGAVMWIAADDGGVSTAVTRASAFTQRNIHPRASNRQVTAITVEPDGSLWMGAFQAGLFHRQASGRVEHWGRPEAVELQPDQPSEQDAAEAQTSPVSLLFDSSGRLWVGTIHRGLSVIAPSNGEIKTYRPIEGDATSLPNVTVTALAERPDATLWVGTFKEGLSHLDPATGRFETRRHDPQDPGSLSENQVRAIKEDSQGRLWVGTRYQGLNLRMPDRDEFRHFRHDPQDPASLADDTIVAIAEDSLGRIWIGTYAGLHQAIVADDGRVRFERYGREHGLLGQKVFSILEDGEGYLWLSSSRGISRFDPATGVFFNLGRDHGLPPSGFGFGAYAKAADGTIYYGSSYGMTSFHPAEVSLDPRAPEIVLTEVSGLDGPMEFAEGSQLRLAHSDRLITFEFSLLDFVATDRNRYEHQLEGFEDEWIDVGNHPRATYSNLPPGSYTFKVRGANSEGIWSAGEATLAIRVMPPLWASWWAYALYVVLGLVMVLAYARHQTRRQQREAVYTQRLEQEVHVRTRELAEQNERLRYANELLEVASVTDSLTGVRNRRFLLSTIDQDIALVDRAFAKDQGNQENSAFVFMLFDLDGFKEINDSYGHSAGDLVLYHVRDLLTQACRTSDTLVRWGGDEFLIVAREATRAHVEALAERVRRSVAEHLFDIGTSEPVQLTCSLGFACYPFVTTNPRLYSWEEVIDIADRALYVAKRHGPNMWAGIFGTDQTEETPSEDLLTLILERPELLSDEGSIRLVTSRPTEVGTDAHATARETRSA